MSACKESSQKVAQPTSDWKSEIAQMLPALGHRNWIVITDAAYPLQSAQGIKTVVADSSYKEVLSFIAGELQKCTHVYPHVYQDREMTFLNDSLCPGIEQYRKDCKQALGDTEVQYMDHEKLIARLDSASRMYNVLLVKTPLTLPFTTTFLELDCKYWDAGQQQKLQAIIDKADR